MTEDNHSSDLLAAEERQVNMATSCIPSADLSCGFGVAVPADGASLLRL